MHFTLYYHGPLRPNGSTQHKHDIRKYFHVQLRNLWSQAPLCNMQWLLQPPTYANTVIRERFSTRWAPLVVADHHSVAELEIDFLRSEPPGRLITSGGDLDNRIKTLLDALRVPPDPSSLPAGTQPDPGEDPFYCLLEDDSLVTKLFIRSDRLLQSGVGQFEVALFIQVTTRQVWIGADAPQMP